MIYIYIYTCTYSMLLMIRMLKDCGIYIYIYILYILVLYIYIYYRKQCMICMHACTYAYTHTCLYVIFHFLCITIISQHLLFKSQRCETFVSEQGGGQVQDGIHRELGVGPFCSAFWDMNEHSGYD